MAKFPSFKECRQKAPKDLSKEPQSVGPANGLQVRSDQLKPKPMIDSRKQKGKDLVPGPSTFNGHVHVPNLALQEHAKSHVTKNPMQLKSHVPHNEADMEQDEEPPDSPNSYEEGQSEEISDEDETSCLMKIICWWRRLLSRTTMQKREEERGIPSYLQSNTSVMVTVFPFQSIFIYIMWILYWNCRRGGNTEFKDILCDNAKIHKIDLLFILEPKISGVRANEAIKDLGLTHSSKADAVGFSRGIWALWNESSWEIDPIKEEDGLISLKISSHGTDPWICTGIYANTRNEKEDLFRTIHHFACTITCLWLIVATLTKFWMQMRRWEVIQWKSIGVLNLESGLNGAAYWSGLNWSQIYPTRTRNQEQWDSL